MSGSGYLVVANGSAGSAETEALRQAVGVLAEAGPAELRWVESDSDLDRAIDSCGERLLVVAGGDGTIHRVVNRVGLAGLDARRTAILPAGTGNDLARNLGLPLDLDEAAAAIVNGRPRSYALLETGGGELITNNLHVGLGVDAANRAAGLKARLGKLAYPVGTVAEAVRHEPLTLQVVIDGQPVFDGDAVACICMLGPSMGGGSELAEVSSRADPAADVVVVSAASDVSRAGLVAAAVRGELEAHAGVTHGQGRRVELAREGSSIEVDMDGEIAELPLPLTLTLRPAAWTIVH